MIRPLATGAIALLLPGRAFAHAAFGDLGPFYGGILHPLAMPAQGLLLCALATLLARQPRRQAQLGFATLALMTLLGLVAASLLALPGPDIRIVAAGATATGLLALTGRALPLWLLVAITSTLAIGAAMTADHLPSVPRLAILTLAGNFIGMVFFMLLLWAALDLMQSYLGRIATAIAASWVAAVGLMVVALPAGPA